MGRIFLEKKAVPKRTHRFLLPTDSIRRQFFWSSSRDLQQLRLMKALRAKFRRQA